MNFRRLILITAVITAAFASCKKDKETETSPNIQGTMRILDLPEFVGPGQKCTLKVKGAVPPEDEKMQYCWKVSPSMSKYDTTEVFVHTFSDTLQTYTVYCTAFATGYTSNSATNFTTVVKGGWNGSVTGKGYPEESSFTVIGDQTWTTTNASAGEGATFRNAPVMADVFGRYYDFKQAHAACESLGEGWQLPSKEDWEKLDAYIKATPDLGKSTAAALMLQNAAFNGTAMWEYWPSVGDITNKSGFSVIPVGYANIKAGSFTGTYEYAAFWTSTSVEGEDSLAYYKYLICDEPDMYTGKADKNSFGASVRCIRK